MYCTVNDKDLGFNYFMPLLISPAKSCCEPCEDECTPEQIPGPQGETGAAGTNGTNGINAFTFTTAGFTQPAVNANVTIAVTSGSWAAVGENIWIEQGGTYEVITVNSAISLTVENLGYTGNAAPTTVIPSGVKVTPSGIKGTDGASAAGDMLSTNNLSDVASVATSQTNLGLGALAVLATVNDAQWSGTDLAVVNGGTASSTASGARTNLGLAIGSDVQAFDALLLAIAALVTAADQTIYSTGVNTVAMTSLTAFARTLLDDADAGAMHATLSVLPRYGILGRLTAVDLNAANNDNAVSIAASRYIVDRVVIENPSAAITTATGGLFSAPAAGGTALANDQALALTATTKWKNLTLQAIAGTDSFTSGTLYLRTGTAEGAARTANFLILGMRLD